MTPEQFRDRMKEIFAAGARGDREGQHMDADDLMCELLESLGYKEGVEIFRQADKWYA